jgi:hypothetical protein
MRNIPCRIAKKDLVDGAYYQGSCRNASVARWNGEREVFVYWRYSFGDFFLEEIKHPEDDKIYDVFIVERILSPEETPAKEIPFR